ncbi:MAG: hypothetical protein JW913_05845 [Chitinispirillaceae bacterium]|nr:hypothetical protein [Chitinispirillaceae bacterium]
MEKKVTSTIPSTIGRIIVVTSIYALHIGALYSIASYFRTKSVIITVGFTISVIFLCLSCIVGWLFAADDFREAFVRYKKAPGEKEPSSEFTVFAPVRFLFAVIMWPYLALFHEPGDQEEGESTHPPAAG